MHTNLDVAVGGVNDCLANALELENIEPLADDEGFCFRKGSLKTEMSTKRFAEFVKEKLGGNVRFAAVEKSIKTVSVCGGAGGSELETAMKNTDAFVTADVKHNVFITAIANNYPLFDAGHYHTERVIIKPLTKKLSNELKAVEFIDNNYEKHLTIDEIASVAGFSKFHFSRLFKNYTGFTVIEHINGRRCENAKLMLENNSLSISQIAAECGFWESSYFTKVFKKIKGCTPKIYRKNIKKECCDK
jgi:AraC-like DNA-binding protein